jgi:2-amino-4-hydroxy-6-hydroxymethyldihydropteridine diphosphokinase
MAPNAEKNSPVVLGLGANLGSRLETLRRAADELERTGAMVIQGRSGVYESPPAGGPAQPDYLNAAVAGVTTLSPAALLEAVLRVERALGRHRPDQVRWGPRPIDIDILWMAELRLHTSGLIVPHPRLRERSFALLPLLDVAPDAHDPADGAAYTDLAAARAALTRVADL